VVDDAVLQARAYKHPAVSPKPHLQKLALDGIRASAKRRALSTLRPVKPMDNANPYLRSNDSIDEMVKNS